MQALGRGGCHAHYSWKLAPPGWSALDAWFHRMLDAPEEMVSSAISKRGLFTKRR